jgi:hypothetical protein
MAGRNRSLEAVAHERGKDEMNLAEFPIAVVAEAARPGQLTLHFADTIPDAARGGMIERSVTVHGTEEWGLPAAHDDDVMVGLLQLSYQAGWPKRIRFTRYELCQLLRWSVGGASYRRIYRALHRLSTTTYNYRYAWRDRTNNEWIPSHVFSYIQALKVHEADRPTQSGRCEVTWSDDFHRSLEAGNLKGIDFGLFISLKSPIAKRLYRFLDKRFGAGRRDYTRDLHELAFEKIGVARSYRDAAQIKRLLTPAIRELEQAGFIQPAPPGQRFRKLRRGKWTVHFVRANRVKPNAPKADSMEATLIDLGILPSQARKFVEDHSKEYLEEKIDQLPFRNPDRNPAGYLATSIREKLPAPDGYQPPEIRAREEKRRQEQRRKTQRQETARKEREESLQATAEELRLQAESALRELPAEALDELRRTARRRFPDASETILHLVMVSLIQDRLSLR